MYCEPGLWVANTPPECSKAAPCQYLKISKKQPVMAFCVIVTGGSSEPVIFGFNDFESAKAFAKRALVRATKVGVENAHVTINEVGPPNLDHIVAPRNKK